MKQLSPSIWRLGAFLLVVIVMVVTLIVPADLAALFHLNIGLPGTKSAHAAAACASPPAGFNPATATAAALASYGLPRRPATTSPTYQHWLNLVKTAKKRTCTLKRTASHGTGLTPSKASGTKSIIGQETSTTLAGYSVYTGTGILSDISGSTVLSCKVPNTSADNNTLITFTSMGPSIAGVTSDSIDGYSFATSVDGGADFQVYSGSIACGDTITFDIQQTSGSYDLWVSDLATGAYHDTTTSGATTKIAYWGITGDPMWPGESLETLNGMPVPINDCTFATNNGPINSLGTGYVTLFELLSQNAGGTPVNRTTVGPLTNGSGTDFTVAINSSN